MSRAFNNLIQNAVEAIGTEKDGLIEIIIAANEESYLVHFKDDGPGIPEDKADMIFSPSFTTKTSGMGLGLALVRSIIVNAGGDISFESIENNGAVFTITLPRVR
jgi:signal transduction histidine kinase